ncbi:MAG: phosphatidate cytidylyltransferase [bacterium]
MNNLVQRVLVAVIAIPIVVFIVLKKPFALYTLVLILSGLTVCEYYGLAKVKGYKPQYIVGVLMTLLVALSFGKFRLQSILSSFGLSVISPQTEMLSVVIICASIVILTVELFRGQPNPLEGTAITLFGPIYIGVGLGSLLGIHEFFTMKNIGLEQFDKLSGGYFLVALLVSIWVGDSAAYFAGKALGKHKIAKHISPGKSWEGAVANLVMTVMVWVLAHSLIYQFANISMQSCIAIGVIIGIIGQFGDFGKSLLKRDVGVKDSSNLIPGHGGVLDRLDSIIFSAPVVLLYLWFFGV